VVLQAKAARGKYLCFCRSQQHVPCYTVTTCIAQIIRHMCKKEKDPDWSLSLIPGSSRVRREAGDAASCACVFRQYLAGRWKTPEKREML
jgi:hypothetical protein